MKGLCILGSTGSVGQNCLRVVENLPDRFYVVSLAAGRNLDVLTEQILKFEPALVAVGAEEFANPLRHQLQTRAYRRPITIVSGRGGLVEAATLPEVEFVVSASHGVTGLEATYEAIRAGKRVGLANKEVLVVAGELVTQLARARGVEILPIDSEHSAVHQCLRSGKGSEVRRLILTGSGGPFLHTPKKKFASLTPEEALKHPIWKMGGRISVDSATLMNKGLEIIEAHWLFGLKSEQIKVLIHPESIVHSMIEFQDGAVMAQLGVADMRIPIQYALTYPDRVAVDGDLSLDLAATRRLHFLLPDVERFPCLELGRVALEKGGSLPCALNAADEIAVEAFRASRLHFTGIPRVIEEVMRQTSSTPLSSLQDVVECDRESRQRAEEIVKASQLRM
jgi:1-deoxy-D-xylulose-5-phosphate reductoisomerase